MLTMLATVTLPVPRWAALRNITRDLAENWDGVIPTLVHSCHPLLLFMPLWRAQHVQPTGANLQLAFITWLSPCVYTCAVRVAADNTAHIMRSEGYCSWAFLSVCLSVNIPFHKWAIAIYTKVRVAVAYERQNSICEEYSETIAIAFMSYYVKHERKSQC